MNRPVHWLATGICYGFMIVFIVPFFVLGCLWCWASAGIELGKQIGGRVQGMIIALGEAK